MRWEYKVVSWNGTIHTNDDQRLQQILNEYGHMGYELVNIIPQIGTSFDEYTNAYNHMVFKKQKE